MPCCMLPVKPDKSMKSAVICGIWFPESFLIHVRSYTISRGHFTSGLSIL